MDKKNERAVRSRVGIKALALSLLSTTFLAAGANAQSFTVLNGQTVGQQTLTTPGDVGTVDAGGTIKTGGHAIVDTGAVDNLTVVNNGTINAASYGIVFEGNFSVVVNTGDIIAGDDGIDVGTDTIIINSGTISGNDQGIDADNRGGLTNNGTIIGATGDGIDFGNEAVIINSDLIQGADDGVEVGGGSTINNSGIISGVDDGIVVQGSGGLGDGIGNIINDGTILATNGDAIDIDEGTITNTAIITGNVGIEVDTATGVVNNSGTISGTSGVGIEFAFGSFDDQVNNFASGAISGDILLRDGDDTLVSDGAIVGDIVADTGDDSLLFTSNSTTTGQILGGDGSDLVTFSGGDISGLTLIDGGDDTGTTDGFIDVLTFTGISGILAGANVTNWESVVIGSGSTISFSDNMLTAGSLQTNAGGILNAAGGLSLIGDLTNIGILSTQNGAAGDIVAVSGGYSGSGQVQVDADFATDTADTLQIAGDVTGGTTSLAVADVSTGLATGNDVLVVDVAGTTLPGDFVLAGGAIASGAFSYDLELIGSQFFLSSVGVNGTGAVYEAAPSVLLGFTNLPTLEQRVGQRQWLSRDSARGPVQPQVGLWLRLHGDRFDITPDASTSGLNYDTRRWGLQIGADVAIDESDNGYWVFGLTGQYGSVNADVTNALGRGDIDANGFGIGATATWYGNSGTYLDAQAQLNWIDTDFTSSTNGDLASGRPSRAYALSLETGYRYELDEQNALVPQAQLAWGRLDSDDFTDGAGNTVDFRSDDSLIGRVGLAYEHEYTEGYFFGDHSQGAGYEGHRQKVYVIENILHQFSSSTSVGVSGSNLSLENEATWAEIGLGGSILWEEEDKRLYLEASYITALDGGGNRHGYGLTAGFRMAW